MSAVSPSIFESIIIESADDPERQIDITLGVVSINYYESILNAAYSITMVVIDTPESIEDKQTGKPTTIYQGLPLRGGEKVYIKIASNCDNNQALDFSKKPLIVRSISNAKLTGKKQVFSLDLVSEIAILNEVNFVERIYSQSSVKLIAEDICRSKLNLQTRDLFIDSTSRNIGFSGNTDKPFSCLNKLAKRSTSTNFSTQNVSAGSFVYQTRKGFYFCAIDTLCAQKPVANYVYNEINVNSVDFVPTPDLPTLDRKILSYSIIKNQDIIGNLKTGAYSSERRFFDPVTFRLSGGQQGEFNSKRYGNNPEFPTLGSGTLGKDILNASQVPNDNLIKKYFNKPSKVVTSSVARGTFSKDVTESLDDDIFQTTSQSMTRYNTIFGQVLGLIIPLNSYLHAGDVVHLSIPLSSNENKTINDLEVSGNYLIKDICHNYSSSGSFTSIKVVRDTYGAKINRK